MESLAENISGLLQRQDSIFSFTLLVAAAAFLGFELFGVFTRWRTPGRRLFPQKMRKDGIEIEAVWTLIPAFVLCLLTFAHFRRVHHHSELKSPLSSTAPRSATRPLELPKESR